MPSKIQLDENLWFLYICLQQSDYKSIDFNAVGEATNLKPPAARMRYTRLRRQIEGGTLIGTHGTPFSGSAEKIAQARKKRKSSFQSRDDVKSADKNIRTENTSQLEKKIKIEHVVSSDDYASSSLDDSDSEDEIPLAKRRVMRTSVVSQMQPLQPSLEWEIQEQHSVNATSDNQWIRASPFETDPGHQYLSNTSPIPQASTFYENMDNVYTPTEMIGRGLHRTFGMSSTIYGSQPAKYSHNNIELPGYTTVQTSDQFNQSGAMSSMIGQKNGSFNTPRFVDLRVLKEEEI